MGIRGDQTEKPFAEDVNTKLASLIAVPELDKMDWRDRYA